MTFPAKAVFSSDYAGYWQTPTHVASPPRPPSPLRPQTPAGDGRRGENDKTSTVPDAARADYGSSAFMHNVGFSAAPLAGDRDFTTRSGQPVR